jgi:hypothetical protein
MLNLVLYFYIFLLSHLFFFPFFSILMDNPNFMPIYQFLAPIGASLEPLEPMILTSSYELRPCLVAIGQTQPFSIARVLSSNQEGNVPKVLSSDQEGKFHVERSDEIFDVVRSSLS